MSLWPCYVCIIKNNDFSELRDEIKKVEVASALYFDFTF